MIARAGLYIGWVGHHNLGDEAMWDLCRRRFPALHWINYDTLASAPNVGQFLEKSSLPKEVGRIIREELRTGNRLKITTRMLVHKLAKKMGGEVGILGGGTIINSATLVAYKQVRRMTGHPVPTFGSGVHNPEFWKNQPGWTDSRREWASVLQDLPTIGVRGPLSKDLLEEVGLTNVVIAGDPAARYHFKHEKAELARPVAGRVAINCGSFGSRVWGNPQQLNESLTELSRELHGRHLDVRFVPVFPEDQSTCLAVCAAARLPKERVLPVARTAGEFIATVSEFDLIVGSRLHASILGAASNVPVLILEYQPKCRDFAMSIGWEDYTIRTDQASPSRLIELSEEMLKRTTELREMISERMAQLAATFESYCKQIEPMLLA